MFRVRDGAIVVEFGDSYPVEQAELMSIAISDTRTRPNWGALWAFQPRTARNVVVVGGGA